MEDNFTINSVSRKHRAIRHGVLIMLMIIYKRKVCILERKQKRLHIYIIMFILQVLTTIYLENELESFTRDENIITTTSYPILGATNRMILAKM